MPEGGAHYPIFSKNITVDNVTILDIAPVHIGGNATILPGVNIGNNVIIAAGAVVTKRHTQQLHSSGVPAKVIRKIENDVEDDYVQG